MVKKRRRPVDEEITEEVPAVEETPEPEPIEEQSFETVVDEVMRGEWGVGQDRRLALAKAGHDPNAVQKEIVRRANSR